MGFLSELKTYDRFKETGREKFSKEELEMISSIVVEEGDYGYSAKITLVSGGYKYCPMDINSNAEVGDELEPSRCEMIQLTKGEDVIYRLYEGDEVEEEPKKPSIFDKFSDSKDLLISI